MSGASGWTTETLFAHLARVIDDVERVADHDNTALRAELAALDRLMQDQRAGDLRALAVLTNANERALDLATNQMDKRLEKLNEFRGALSDAQATMMPRLETKLLIDSLVARIEGMQRTISSLNEVLVGLRSSLEGQDTGADAQQHATDRNRTFVFALLAAFLGLTSLFLGLRTPHAATPTPTTTTTPAKAVP